MRSFPDAACFLVAAGSIALAAWQPAVPTDPLEADAAAPAHVMKKTDERLPTQFDRAVAAAPRVKA